MVVNFKTRGISRSMHKLVRTSTLIIKKNIIIEVLNEYINKRLVMSRQGSKHRYEDITCLPCCLKDSEWWFKVSSGEKLKEKDKFFFCFHPCLSTQFLERVFVSTPSFIFTSKGRTVLKGQNSLFKLKRYSYMLVKGAKNLINISFCKRGVLIRSLLASYY
jgi:hypothetical protein